MKEAVKRILILPEYWVPHMFALLRGFHDVQAEGVEVFWSNRKWNREDFCVSETWDSPTYLPIEHAMKRLNEGFFDAVVLSDGTSVGYLTTKLAGKTMRVMMDVTDHRYVNEAYLYFADVYLKTQHPSGDILVGGSVDLSSIKPSIPIIPWPYCCGGEGEGCYEAPETRENVVYFRGWGWPCKRIDMVRAIVEAKLPFKGGLYQRKDLLDSQLFPSSLTVERVDFKTYLRELASSSVAINPVGNGEICFRTMEAMRLGVAVVTQKIDVRWPARPPVNGEEWVVVSSDEEAVSACRALIENESVARRIGEAGRLYWERYCTDRFAARRLLQILGWEQE